MLSNVNPCFGFANGNNGSCSGCSVCSSPINTAELEGDIGNTSPPYTSTFITSLLLADIVYNTYSGNSIYSNFVFLTSNGVLTIALSLSPTQVVNYSTGTSGTFSGATMVVAVGSPSSSGVYAFWVEATYTTSSGSNTYYGLVGYNDAFTECPLYMYAIASTTEDTCWFLGVQLQFST